MNLNLTFKWLFSLFGGLIALIQPTFEIFLICVFAILVDMYTAYSLSRRVRKKYPGSNNGKFRSNYASKVFNTLIKIYLLLVLAYLIDVKVLYFLDGMFLANFTAGFFCFVQIWSILENESSENDAKWAKVLQKVMVNKAERHFDIQLEKIMEETNEDKSKGD